MKNLEELKFNISRIFYINDSHTYIQSNEYKQMVAVDNKKKKIALIDYESSELIIIKFNEFLDYEVYKNGVSYTTGGNVGSIWGGIFNAKTEENCKELKLIIRIKKIDKPQITYDIIKDTVFNMGENIAGKAYSECIKTLQEFVSFLEVVKSENKQKSLPEK
ncbi:MAG: hypothetical protein E7378_00650 [Clostridiales bacterium]|nr:hypothetical protein [Clostridiales bacterium]